MLNFYLEIVYVLVDIECGLLIIVEECVEVCMSDFKLMGCIIVIIFGVKFVNLCFYYLFVLVYFGYKCIVFVYFGDYVMIDIGIGVVYLLFVYGIEDFMLCKVYGMIDFDFINLVMGDGCYIELLLLFGGLLIWDVNLKIVDVLNVVGLLLCSEKYMYSYMYCWCYKMLIIYCVML